MSVQELRLPALAIRQGKERTLYSFAIDGKELQKITTVSRVRREKENEKDIQGYQRPEVISHIDEIRRYLESENPMIPNALVIAFDSRVKFEPESGVDEVTSYSQYGNLVIPIDLSLPDHEKPGWIVDGQQRAAAIRNARVSQFPICVTAFISDDMGEQRSQFILVNSTKPLPKGLIYELLPSTSGMLPSLLQRRKFPAYLLERLNYEPGPFQGKIKTITNPDGIVKDNSILKMLENSLFEGALYHYRDPDTGAGDAETILAILNNYWEAVSEVFEDAWGLPPRQSRLMHGAGIVSLGFIMDDIVSRYRSETYPTKEQFAADLEPLEEICCWTKGTWDFGPEQQRNWDELQNTSKDIQLLANYLRMEYRYRVIRNPQMSMGF